MTIRKRLFRASVRVRAWDYSNDLTRNILQLAVFLVALGSIILAVIGYSSQQRAKRIDATFEFAKRVQDDAFTSALWNLAEFTKCFESKRGHQLSYRRYDEITADQEWHISKALATSWWDYVENDDALTYCSPDGKPRAPGALEHQVFIVYSRVEALASCGLTKICDLDLLIKEYSRSECAKRIARDRRVELLALANRSDIVDSLLESFDWQSLLAISNYLLISGVVSREWGGQAGNFPLMIKRLEGLIGCHGWFNEEQLKNLRQMRRGYGTSLVNEIQQ